MRLPKEIRLQILEYDAVPMVLQNFNFSAPPAFKVCRQLRNEAISMTFGIRDLIFELPDLVPQSLGSADWVSTFSVRDQRGEFARTVSPQFLRQEQFPRHHRKRPPCTFWEYCPFHLFRAIYIEIRPPDPNDPAHLINNWNQLRFIARLLGKAQHGLPHVNINFTETADRSWFSNGRLSLAKGFEILAIPEGKASNLMLLLGALMPLRRARGISVQHPTLEEPDRALISKDLASGILTPVLHASKGPTDKRSSAQRPVADKSALESIRGHSTSKSAIMQGSARKACRVFLDCLEVSAIESCDWGQDVHDGWDDWSFIKWMELCELRFHDLLSSLETPLVPLLRLEQLASLTHFECHRLYVLSFFNPNFSSWYNTWQIMTRLLHCAIGMCPNPCPKPYKTCGCEDSSDGMWICTHKTTTPVTCPGNDKARAWHKLRRLRESQLLAERQCLDKRPQALSREIEESRPDQGTVQSDQNYDEISNSEILLPSTYKSRKRYWTVEDADLIKAESHARRGCDCFEDTGNWKFTYPEGVSTYQHVLSAHPQSMGKDTTR